MVGHNAASSDDNRVSCLLRRRPNHLRGMCPPLQLKSPPTSYCALMIAILKALGAPSLPRRPVFLRQTLMGRTPERLGHDGRISSSLRVISQ